MFRLHFWSIIGVNFLKNTNNLKYFTWTKFAQYQWYLMQLWSADQYTRSKTPRNSSELSSIASICLNLKLRFIFNKRCYITYKYFLTSFCLQWFEFKIFLLFQVNPLQTQWIVICCALKFHTIHKSQRAFLSSNKLNTSLPFTKVST